MTTLSMVIEEDCTVLLERALLRQTVCAFGEDGCGMHGKSDTPAFFDIVDIHVDVVELHAAVQAKASICLRGYNHNDVGHIQTDKNFDISFDAILKASNIPRNAFTWAPIDEQLQGCVTFYLDVTKLLS